MHIAERLRQDVADVLRSASAPSRSAANASAVPAVISGAPNALAAMYCSACLIISDGGNQIGFACSSFEVVVKRRVLGADVVPGRIRDAGNQAIGVVADHPTNQGFNDLGSTF